ncbi:unnamed protein product [Effrenium voratum]|nr:unnamed protein product [Effrenium voratum]
MRRKSQITMNSGNSTQVIEKVGTLRKMESQLLRELGGSFSKDLAQFSSSGPTEKRKRSSVASLVSVDESNATESQATSHITAATRVLGLESPRMRATASRMGAMNRETQTHILHEHSLTDLEMPETGFGFHVLLRRSRLMCFAVALPWLGHVAACIAWPAMGQHLPMSSFNFVSANLYAVLAITCGLMLSRALHSCDMVLAIQRLHMFVADFEVKWQGVSGQEWRKYALAWLFVVGFEAGSRAMQLNLEDADGQAWVYTTHAVSLLSFAISSAVLLLVAYVQSHLLLGLDKSLDCWCFQIVNSPDFALGVQNWNAMQALLKCVSRELEGSFLALQALACLGFIFFIGCSITLTFGTDFQVLPVCIELLHAMPLPVLYLLSIRVCAHGASLTEKSRSIPAFVNQIPTRNCINQERSYLVRFILDSSAGFSVRDVKLTQELFMKQVVPLCGKKGVTPVAQFLAQVREDFPGLKKWAYFPTLLWLGDSDAILQLTNRAGLIGGLLAIYGGIFGWLGLFLSRLALQSLAVTGEFWFVWDYMVFEAGALVLLLPQALPLHAGLGASHLPVPCVALAWQLLAIRLMLGFAKTKFSNANVAKDNLFLQGFFVWQLLPNKLAWHLHHAPLWILRALYGGMIYVEVVLPFCGFFSGAPRCFGAWGLILLMFGIFLTGNWGQFNIGYALVCVGLFDLEIQWSFSAFFSGSWLLPPLMLVYVFISLINGLFDTWTNTSWPWFNWEIIPGFELHGLIGLVRLLAPFRLINAYGVFPPEALPHVRSSMVFQGSNDGNLAAAWACGFLLHRSLVNAIPFRSLAWELCLGHWEPTISTCRDTSRSAKTRPLPFRLATFSDSEIHSEVGHG